MNTIRQELHDIVPPAKKPRGFQKGQSGNPAGKKPGTKNINKRLDVYSICERLNCNPFEILCQIVNDNLEWFEEVKETEYLKKISARLRMEAAAELAQYLAPKLRAIDLSSDPNSPVKININLGNQPMPQLIKDITPDAEQP